MADHVLQALDARVVTVGPRPELSRCRRVARVFLTSQPSANRDRGRVAGLGLVVLTHLSPLGKQRPQVIHVDFSPPLAR